MCYILERQALRGYQIYYWEVTSRPLGGHLKTTWGPLGVHLGATWRLLGDHLGFTWGPLGVHLGTTWGPLGGHLAATWGPLGNHLGTSSRACLGHHLGHRLWHIWGSLRYPRYYMLFFSYKRPDLGSGKDGITDMDLSTSHSSQPPDDCYCWSSL